MIKEYNFPDQRRQKHWDWASRSSDEIANIDPENYRYKQIEISSVIVNKKNLKA